MKSYLATIAVLLAMPWAALAALRGQSNANEDHGRNLGFGLVDWKKIGKMTHVLNLPTDPPQQAQTCTSNNDCAQDSYCAAGTCMEMGSCETNFDCRNPGNSYAVIECTGPLICDENKQCGRVCGPTCEDGTNDVQCLADPCLTAADTCTMSFSSCQSDYCGGCNALVFNDAGYSQLCAEPTPCNSTLDCGESEYCLAGKCAEGGMCSSDADCFNPDNIYAVTFCVGPISCFEETGMCGRTCSSNDCPVDEPPVQCLVSPCETIATTCNETIASCVDYYCGGCDAFVFDKAGNQICKAEPSCNSTLDCGESEYCSAGKCVEGGKCSSDADCFNPDNIYAVTLCVGPISCFEETGMCGRTCSSNDCPVDEPPVQCLVSPCETIATTCNETIASCVDYYCGGCDAFVFDKAGNQICKAESSGNPSSPSESGGVPCSSSTDCDESEYCGGGVCLSDGRCNADVDCKNPNNQYATVACVGVLECSGDGGCGVQCGASFCPDGKEAATNCLVAPCDVISCQETYEYCIDDYCGGCNAILLDAAGHEVTCTPV